jgi:hypothetical protein
LSGNGKNGAVPADGDFEIDGAKVAYNVAEGIHIFNVGDRANQAARIRDVELRKNEVGVAITLDTATPTGNMTVDVLGSKFIDNDDYHVRAQTSGSSYAAQCVVNGLNNAFVGTPSVGGVGVSDATVSFTTLSALTYP